MWYATAKSRNTPWISLLSSSYTSKRSKVPRSKLAASRTWAAVATMDWAAADRPHLSSVVAKLSVQRRPPRASDQQVVPGNAPRSPSIPQRGRAKVHQSVVRDRGGYSGLGGGGLDSNYHPSSPSYQYGSWGLSVQRRPSTAVRTTACTGSSAARAWAIVTMGVEMRETNVILRYSLFPLLYNVRV